MEVYQVGPDALTNDELNVGAKWFVYHYENGGYDGWGQAVYMTESGDLYTCDLGHCSCYGPMDDPPTLIQEDMFHSDSVVDVPSSYPEVDKKVRELLARGANYAI